MKVATSTSNTGVGDATVHLQQVIKTLQWS